MCIQSIRSLVSDAFPCSPACLGVIYGFVWQKCFAWDKQNNTRRLLIYYFITDQLITTKGGENQITGTGTGWMHALLFIQYLYAALPAQVAVSFWSRRAQIESKAASAPRLLYYGWIGLIMDVPVFLFVLFINITAGENHFVLFLESPCQ